MLRCNIKEMSDMELKEHIDAINDEILRRYNQRAAELWNAVREALHNYIDEVGPIIVYDKYECNDVHLDHTILVDEIGSIKFRYDED